MPSTTDGNKRSCEDVLYCKEYDIAPELFSEVYFLVLLINISLCLLTVEGDIKGVYDLFYCKLRKWFMACCIRFMRRFMCCFTMRSAVAAARRATFAAC